MKIFVTGATGYIGQLLTIRLLEQGHELNILCRKKPSWPEFEKSSLKVFLGELSDKETLLSAIQGCQVVYHLAGVARVWMKDPADYYRINVQGTGNVFEAALKAGAQKVVFTSTGGVFGASENGLLNEESIRLRPFFTDYESSKYIAETLVHQYHKKGLEIVTVFPTKVYGPGIWTESNAVCKLIRLYLTGRWRIIPGNGKMIGNFSFVDDILDGIVLAVEKGMPGERYILGGVNISFNEFFSMIKDHSGKSYRMIHAPMPLMLLYGLQQELMANVFGLQPKITRKWVRKFNHDLALSSDKATTHLGYQVTPIEVGMRKTVNWVKDQLKQGLGR